MEIRFKHAVITAGTHGFQRPTEGVRGHRFILAFETNKPRTKYASSRSVWIAAIAVLALWTAYVALRASDVPDTKPTANLTWRP